MHTYPQPHMEGDEQASGEVNYQLGDQTTGEYLNPYGNSRPHREKFNSILILGIGIFAVLIGGVSMWINLANPFADIISEGAKQRELLAAQQQAELIALQSKDSDADGLSDYDEANKYNSSAYLKDSDGDGVDDKAEVTNGTDPNCPEGQNCFYSGDSAAASSSVDNLQTSIANPLVQITPAYIRQIMKDNGATDEQLGAFTDDELMAEFKAYLAANPALAKDLESKGVNVNIGATSPSASTQPNAGSIDLKALNINSSDDLQKLTGAQIRQLMINAGASASLLSQVSDEQLKTMFMSQLEAKSPTTVGQ